LITAALGVAVLFSAALPLCADDDATAARTKLDADFAETLATLAGKCEKLNLPEQAGVTRNWILRRAPDRRYVFLVPESNPTKPSADAPRLIHQWHAKFMEHRKAHAEALFKLARQELDAHRPDSAYALVHEVLREDPDHALARRVLGFHKVNDRWRQMGVVERVRRSPIRHPKLGWAAGKFWRVDTPHFEIVTNHTPDAGRELGRRLEDLYCIWRQLFVRYWTTEAGLRSRFDPKAAIRPPVRKHRVVLFRDREEYVTQLSGAQPQIAMTSGYYVDRQQTVFFYWGNGSNESTWFHEATHQLFQETRRGTEGVGRRGNFWIVEGVALYMESIQRHDGYCTVGGIEAGRVQYARRNALCAGFYAPLAEVVAMGQDDVQRDERIRRLYSQFAAVTHFLMDYDGGRYRGALVEYVLNVYQHRADTATLSRAADAPYDRLDAQYREFLGLTDADLAAIPRNARITKLALGNTAVTDKGLASLPDLSELQWLDLSASKITDKGIARLAEAEKLDALTLQHTPVTDASMATIGKLTRLEQLDVSATSITDEGLADLRNLKKLEALWLTGTSITDAGLEHLKTLKHLKTLDVSDTRVTEKGLAALKRALPSLKNGD